VIYLLKALLINILIIYMTRLRGDVNNDGNINTLDVTAILSHLVDLSGYILTDPIDLEAADANNDGSIGTLDATYILSHIVGLSGYETFDPMPEPEPEPEILECLTQETIINIVSSNGNKYVFNNSTTYDANKVYGLTSGTYTFKNIPQQHPIALLNKNGKESLITYVGDSDKELTETVTNTVTNTSEDVSYNFYYGDISVNVNGDFGNLSVYCYYHGYMGGENLLAYSDTCTLPLVYLRQIDGVTEYKISSAIPALNSIKLFFNSSFTHDDDLNPAPGFSFVPNTEENSILFYSIGNITTFDNSTNTWAPLYIQENTNVLMNANQASYAVPGNTVTIGDDEIIIE
jgi:hypothetical protein